MIFKKENNESIKDFTIRLCKNKDLYNLTFYEIGNIINAETGENKDSSTYRKWWSNYSEGFEDGIEQSINNNDLLLQLQSAKIELQKEKYKLFDQRNAFNKNIRSDARVEELIETIKGAIANNHNLPVLKYEKRESIKQSSNDILCSLNDLHFGAIVDNYWNKYNSDICSDYLEKYLQEIIEISQLHKSQRCIVWANGDMISGKIHKSILNKENLIQQIMGVSEQIAQFLSKLSEHFDEISYISVSGNHSRLDDKDSALKDERLDDLVEWYLKARLQNFDNITIKDGERIDETMYLISIRGLNYVGIHGDYDNGVKNLLSLPIMTQKPIYAILSGHLHHNATNYVQGIKTIMAGSFLGMDDFCVKNRIYGGPQQSVSICTNKGVKCTYDINF